MDKPTVGSLFAGIGGIDLGLELAGFECKWQVEIDPYARQVLHKHWPEVPKFEDVREFPPAGDFKVDLICGGFPCQDISYAGKGAGLDGERSGLFYELIRVVSLVGPRFVLLENVSALLTRGLDQVLGTLASIGYDAEWHCISAAHVGAPHIRDRVFILAYRKGDRREQGVTHNGRCEEGNGTGKKHRPTDSGEVLAQSQRKRQQGQRKPFNSSNQAKVRERETANVINGSFRQIWKPEPDVGRTIDGFSSWLDGTGLIAESHERIMGYGYSKGAINANEKKERSSEIVRTLRDQIREEDIQWEARGLFSIPATAVLFAYLCKLEERCVDEARVFMEGKEASEERMRGMRSEDEPKRTSHRSGYNEQSKRKHPDTLQALSRLLAFDSEKAWSRYRRENAKAVLNWESGISRVADGIPRRVDRLRGLGNAVVPQVAEYIGRQLIKCFNPQ